MKTIVFGAIAIIILFFANLAWGSVNIPWQDVGAILAGNHGDEADSFRYIVMESRLPAGILLLFGRYYAGRNSVYLGFLKARTFFAGILLKVA